MNRNKKIIITMLLLLAIAILGIVAYVCYDKGFFSKQTVISDSDDSESNDVIDNHYSGKSYSEILSEIDVNKFNKDKFDGKFLIKKANAFPMGDEISYYDINGESVDKYKISTVFVTWEEIANYNSSLYEGLDITRNISYSSHSIYRSDFPNETLFYLNAAKSDNSATETLKDSFDKHNVGLFWSSKSVNNRILAKDVIRVPSKAQSDNQLGIFLDLLGEPSGIYEYNKTNRGDVSSSEIDFDYKNNYYLFWEYDEYYIKIWVEIIVKNDKVINEGIQNVYVYSNQSSLNNYQKEISELDKCCKM